MSLSPILPSPDSFLELLAHARSGSPTATGQLLEECREYLVQQARWLLPRDLRSKTTAFDLVQDTIVAAYCHFPAFRGECAIEFREWLHAILKHTVSDLVRSFHERHKRRSSREKTFHLHERNSPDTCCFSTEPDPSDEIIRREFRYIVSNCLGELAEHNQRVLRLRYAEQHSFQQIGSILGISDEAARKLCNRAEHKLAGLLQARGLTPDSM